MAKDFELPRYGDGQGCGGMLVAPLARVPKELEALIQEAAAAKELAEDLRKNTVEYCRQTVVAEGSHGLNVWEIKLVGGTVYELHVRNGKDADIEGCRKAIADAVVATGAANDAAADATAKSQEAQRVTAGAKALSDEVQAEEVSRQEYERLRASAEFGRVNAEKLRVDAEQGRAAAESARGAAEAQRRVAEESRAEAEGQRVVAEADRAAAEALREGTFAANERQRGETFAANEQERQREEGERAAAEAQRRVAEESRAEAEGLRAAEFGRAQADRAEEFAGKEAERDAAVAVATALTPRVENVEGGLEDLALKTDEEIYELKDIVGVDVDKKSSYNYTADTKSQTRTVRSGISLKKGVKYDFYLTSETSINVKQISLRLRVDADNYLAYNNAVVGDGGNYSLWDGKRKKAFSYTPDKDYEGLYLNSYIDSTDDFTLGVSIQNIGNGLIQSVNEVKKDLSDTNKSIVSTNERFDSKNVPTLSFNNIKVRKKAEPVSIYNGWLNITNGVLTESATAKTYYFDHSVIIKAAVTRGTLTAAITYLDKDNKVLGYEHVGDFHPVYNIVADITKYADCTKIAVCASTEYRVLIYDLSDIDYRIENYLNDGALSADFIDENGNTSIIDTCVCTDYIEVKAGDSFIYNGAGGANQPFAFYNENKEFVCKAGVGGTDYKTQHVTSPIDGYMRVYSRNYLQLTYASGERASLVKGHVVIQEVNIIWDKTGYSINPDGSEKQITDPTAYYRYMRISNYIPVNYCAEYLHFYSVVCPPSSNKGVYFYNKDKVCIGSVAMTRLHYSANDYWAADYVLHVSDIPNGTMYMRIIGIDECSNADIGSLAQMTALDTRIFWVPNVRSYDMDLRGKKLANIGPSSSVYPSTMAWKNIVKLNTGLNITDYGVGGTGMSGNVSTTWNGQKQVDAALASGVQYDYFILWLSGNDYSGGAEIGDYNSYTSKDGYNTDALSTVCGGLNYCIKKIAEAQPNARIICMSPMTTFINDGYYDPHTSTTNKIGKRLMEYVEAHKQVCENKHIPWYSLRNMGINEFNYKSYFRADNLHLTAEGNKLLIPYVMKVLRENTY